MHTLPNIHSFVSSSSPVLETLCNQEICFYHARTLIASKMFPPKSGVHNKCRHTMSVLYTVPQQARHTYMLTRVDVCMCCSRRVQAKDATRAV